jgi:hypothetical protein
MTARTGRDLLAVAIATALAAAPAEGRAAAGARAAAAGAADLVKRWRAAVHAIDWSRPRTFLLLSTADEDGIPGTVREWVSTGGAYRRKVDRGVDASEVVLSEGAAERRDRNGFVRTLRGQELARWRAAAFESAVLAFGPPAPGSSAAVLESTGSERIARPEGDRTLYRLRFTPRGGASVTWYLDAETGLPARSVRPGAEGEITTTYDDWRSLQGVRTPQRARVSEALKPEYQWRRTGAEAGRAAVGDAFHPPAPGPPDTRLDADAPPIPFSFESSHIIFKVGVNGREPIDFILDTGADENVLNTSRLGDYGLKAYARSAATGGGGTAEYDYVAGATFTLPGVEIRGQHVAALEQGGLERALGIPLGGILGYDFISRFVLEIDYEKSLITLHDPGTWSYSGSGITMPIVFDSGIPHANGTISVLTKPAIPAFLVLDFGAAETMTLTSPFVKENDLARLAGTNPAVNRPAGLERQFFAQNNMRGRVDRLALGGLTVESIPMNLSLNTEGAYASPDFSGTVGEGIFRRYHVYLDYARERVILEPGPDAGKPFPERKTYGLSILALGPDLRTYSVAAVRPGSPAERDGFRSGDTIAAMDREPPGRFTLGQLRERLSHDGERHDLTVQRGAERLTVSVEVRTVSLDAR